MSWLVSLIQLIAAPLMPVMEALISALASSAHRSPTASDCTVAAFALSTALIGLACILLTCWTNARLQRARQQARLDNAAADVGLYFRAALLAGAAQGVIVLRSGDQDRQYFGDGKSLLESCMQSPHAVQAAKAIDDLAEQGARFALTVPCGDWLLSLRGMPVAGRAVVYLDRTPAADNLQRFRDVLEALPVPVWIRGATNALSWANEAFLSPLGFANLQEAVIANAALEPAERGLAAAALKSRKPGDGLASITAHGETRMLAFDLTPLPDGGVCGIATDITERARLEAKLKLACDAQDDMVARIPFAVAVFDDQQKLVSYNRAYARMWDFPENWLDGKPCYADILDRLRDTRRIPERRNFAEWKLAHLKAFDVADKASEESWHMPNGKSVRILLQPQLKGGKFMLQEDVTERIRLEASLNLMNQVQQSTLDTLDEGVAIFGTDGRLILHNARFGELWSLSERELAGQPHFAELANLCSERIGRDGIWGVVSCGINSAIPERLGEWAKARRADGKLLSLTLRRLPNGATLVRFSDETELEQFDQLQSGPTHAVA